MENPRVGSRPKSLKFVISVLAAWTGFMISMVVLSFTLLMVQTHHLMIEVEGQPALIVLGLMFLASLFLSITTTKRLNRFLDSKPLATSHLFLVVLIILSLLLIPAPMLYVVF